MDGCHVLATGSTDKLVFIWRVCQGQAQLSARITDHSGQLRSMQWSPSGLLASATEDSGLQVHNYLGDDRVPPLYNLYGHRGEIQSVWWEPGRGSAARLASSATDGTVRVWNLWMDDTNELGNYSSYRVEQTCRYMQWLDSNPPRIACARSARSPGQTLTIYEDPPYSYHVEYSLTDFDYSLNLLGNLTYGTLDQEDLEQLGYADIRSTVMDPQILNFTASRAPPEAHPPLAGECQAAVHGKTA